MNIERELLAVARELVGKSKLTETGEKIKKSILDDYKRWGSPEELKAADAILRKYHRELGDDEFYHWDMKKLKVSKPHGDEHISIKNRASVVTWTVDASIKILGKTYKVKDIVVDSTVNGI